MGVYDGAYDYQVAWAAGFFDGEGCVTILKQIYESSNGQRKYSHRVHVAISQNNYEVLQNFKDVMGIHARIYKRKRTITTNKQCYTLNYDGLHAYRLLVALRPFLVRKGVEVDAIKSFWIEGRMEERRKTGRKPVTPEILAIREKWYRKLKKMK